MLGEDRSGYRKKAADGGELVPRGLERSVAQHGLNLVEYAGESVLGFPIWMIRLQTEAERVAKAIEAGDFVPF